MSFLFFLKQNLLLFFLGARVKTLLVIFIPVLMSSSWAFYQTNLFKKEIFFFTMLSALLIQLATNFFNEASDLKQNLDNFSRLGPKRQIQSNKKPIDQFQYFGFLSCLLALLSGIPLILEGGWPICALGLLSCFLAYLYTGSSFSLLKQGLSELMCFLFFGLFAVLGTYYLQTLKIDSQLIYLGIQCGLWAVSILLINHLRDEKEDLQRKRKHFVTLYGRTHSLFFLFVVQALIYLLCFFWLGQGLFSGALCFFLMPLSALLLYFIFTNKASEKYNLYLSLCSFLYALFGGFWIVGLFIK